MKDYQENMDWDDVIRQRRVLVVQYGRQACTPCASVRAKIESWLEEQPNIAGIYVDVDCFKAVGAQRGIFSVPSVVVYFDGKLTIQESGYFSLEAIFDQIKRYQSLMGVD